MPPPEKLLTELTKISGRQPRTHALWVDERDTPRRYRRQARSLDRRGTGTPRRHVCVRALEKARRSLRARAHKSSSHSHRFPIGTTDRQGAGVSAAL